MDPKDISINNISYKKSLGFKEDNLSDKFSNFCWTPMLHKIPYKHCFFALPFYFTTKPLSVSYFSLKRNCQTCHNSYIITEVSMKSGLLTNSSELLQKNEQLALSKHHQFNVFPTLCTPSPHQKLKDRLHMLVNQTFLYKNGSHRYMHLVVNGDRTFFTNETSAGRSMIKP